MVEDPSTKKSSPFLKASDEELAAMLQHAPRDRVMQAEIYDRFSKRIYFKCLSIVKNPNTAKDYAHDIFIKIYTKIDQFKGRSKFSLWVHSITYNYCIKQISRKQIEISNFDDYQEDSSESELIAVPQDAEIQIALLKKSLDRLSQEDRLLLTMKYWDDLKIEEISKILGSEQSAIKMRLKRARDRMKKHISTLSQMEE